MHQMNEAHATVCASNAYLLYELWNTCFVCTITNRYYIAKLNQSLSNDLRKQYNLGHANGNIIFIVV